MVVLDGSPHAPGLFDESKERNVRDADQRVRSQSVRLMTPALFGSAAAVENHGVPDAECSSHGAGEISFPGLPTYGERGDDFCRAASCWIEACTCRSSPGNRDNPAERLQDRRHVRVRGQPGRNLSCAELTNTLRSGNAMILGRRGAAE